jgi:small subunit ribosomal protein S20
MANHPSAEKRNRQRVKRTDRNRAVKSAVRTVIKKARVAIESAPKEAAAVVKAAVRAVDRAKSKGVVHKKAASRKKSRLSRALHKATVANKAPVETKATVAKKLARAPLAFAGVVAGERIVARCALGRPQKVRGSRKMGSAPALRAPFARPR